MKKIVFLFLIVFFITRVKAQTTPPDTITKSGELKEVVICDKHEQEEELFNFHKSNKSNTTEDILARMPGVFLIRRGSYGMEPMLRGYSAGQMNLTLDGMKIVGACTDKMDPVTIYVEPVNLQGLQVSTGVSGAGMGSSLGGGMNMTLKEAEFLCSPRPFTGFSSSFATVNRGTTNSAFFNASNSRIAWRVSGVYRFAQNYHTASQVSIPHSGYEKANISTSLVYKLSENSVLKADYLNDMGWNIGFPALTMDVGFARADIASVSHRYLNAKSKIQKVYSKLYLNRINHRMDDTHRPYILMHMDMPGKSQTMGYYSEIGLKTRGRHHVSGRVDFYHSQTKADMTMYPFNEPIMYLQTLPNNYRINAGAFVKDELTIDSTQRIIMSVRLDRNLSVMDSKTGNLQWSVFGAFPTQRVFFTKNIQAAWCKAIGKNWYTQFSAGYAERVPTPNELYGYYLYNRLDNFDYLGNMLIKTEQAWQGEWTWNYTKAKTMVSLTGYYHHINRYILGQIDSGYSPMTFGARGVKAYFNIPHATIMGADFTINNPIARKLDHIITIKLVIGSTSFNTPLPQIPPLKCLHVLRYKIRKWLFQGEADWSLPQYRNNKQYGEPQTPFYMVFNLRTGYKFNSGSHAVQLGISVENITDRRYREHLDFNIIPRPGRNIVVNLSYAFH